MKRQTKKLNSKKIIQVVTMLILCLILVFACIFGYSVYKDTATFDSKKLLSSGASVMYDSNGDIMYTYGSQENGTRKNVTYDDLPQVLVDAIVAAEDSRFFEHNGFDLPRIVKAALSNLKAGDITGGGSTITQQLIKKTYFPDAQRTYSRKFSEIILAIQADKALSKEEILTLYLNKIYFGRSTSSIGIAAATKYYFNKDVSELTLPEAAMLAGSLNSPYNYDPYYCLNNATKRRNTILKLMVKHGYITQSEYDEAVNTKIENTLCASPTTNNNTLAAYVDMVTAEVKKRTKLDPLKTQMNIYTYCDVDTQTLASALGNGEKYSYSDEDMRMGGSVQSSQDGRIVAVIGGRNYNFGNYSYATSKQQPGSSVKPFLDYGLAFGNLDWCTGKTLEDTPYSKGKFTPKNWDRKFHGTVTLTSALENSWNIPAIKTYEEVTKEIGKSGVTSAMESIGIDMSSESNVTNLSYAIGGWNKGISPVEMASAYATISNNGLYTESHTINYIEVVQTGERYEIDKEIQNNAKQSDYSKASAYMVRQVMLDYTKNGSGNYAYLSGLSNVGAKTGTSNWGSSAKKGMAGKSRDLWMTAYNSNYICSVWMGFGQEGIEKGKTTSRYKAYPGKVVQMLLKHLQSKGGKKSYPSQPSTVVKDGDEYYKKGTKHEGHAAISEETTEETQTEETQTEENQTDTNENQSSETNNNSNNQNNNSNTNTENNGSSNNGTSTDNSGTSSGTTGGNTSGGSSGGNSSSSSGESSQPNPNTNQ